MTSSLKDVRRWFKRRGTSWIRTTLEKSPPRISVSLELTTAGIFSVTQNQDYLDGKKTKEEILEDFLNNFEGTKGNQDGIITRNEWYDYYSDLSSSIASD